MLDFALQCGSPASIRYPKTRVEQIPRDVAPIELGRAEVLSWGEDGNILACGTLLAQAVRAAAHLRAEGLDVGVSNARFVKPVDAQWIARAAGTGFIVTIEENALAGGFGGAVLESAALQGLSCDRIRTLGIPDKFVEHGDREELLAELGLNAASLVRQILTLVGQSEASAIV
jgi:1-deoxy-D-xylulose-5-phosphate synthase